MPQLITWHPCRCNPKPSACLVECGPNVLSTWDWSAEVGVSASTGDPGVPCGGGLTISLAGQFAIMVVQEDGCLTVEAAEAPNQCLLSGQVTTSIMGFSVQWIVFIGFMIDEDTGRRKIGAILAVNINGVTKGYYCSDPLEELGDPQYCEQGIEIGFEMVEHHQECSFLNPILEFCSPPSLTVIGAPP